MTVTEITLGIWKNRLLMRIVKICFNYVTVGKKRLNYFIFSRRYNTFLIHTKDDTANETFSVANSCVIR